MNIHQVENQLGMITSSLGLIGDAPTIDALWKVQRIIAEVRFYKWSVDQNVTATQVTEAHERLVNFLQTLE